MKKSKLKISIIEKTCIVFYKCKAAKIYGGTKDHHDNDGIPPDEADRSDWKK